MNIEGTKILVLGGYGLVGMAVCRELLERKPREIQIHSLRQEEAEEAVEQLGPYAEGAKLTASSGDIFGLLKEAEKRVQVWAQLKTLQDKELPSFRLYSLLTRSRPDIVIDCVNTATGIAYRDVYSGLQQGLGRAHRLEPG